MAAPNVSWKSSVFKTLFILFFLFFANQAGVQSCAYYYDWPDMNDTLSLIEPGIVRESIFNGEYLFYSEPYGVLSDRRTYGWTDWSQWSQFDRKENGIMDANLDEWAAYLKSHGMKRVNREALQKFIYNNDSDLIPQDESLDWQTNEANQKKKLAENQDWVKEMVEGKVGPQNPFAPFASQKDLVEYVNFLDGSNESLRRAQERPGHYDPKLKTWVADTVRITKELSGHLNVAEARAHSKNYDDFFRVKYAFQAMQIQAADELYPDMIHLYDEVVSPSKSNGLTRYRCLGYKAAALCGMKQEAKAFPLYVDLFDQCPSMRFAARQSVQFTLKAEEAEILASRIVGEHRKTAAYFLAAVAQPRGYSVKLIEGMVEHGAQEEQTEAMLVRMVEALEKDNMNKDRLALVGASEKAGTQYEELTALCQKVGADPKAGQPALWFGVAAYLYLLEGNAPQAETLLEKAKSYGTKNKALSHQLQVWGTLLAFEKDKKSVGSDTQKGLIEDLQWAKTLKNWGNNKGLYHSLLVVAGGKYLSLMDLPRSILCFEAARGLYGVWGPTAYGHPWDQRRDDRVNDIYNFTFTTANYLIDAIATEDELSKLGSMLKGEKERPLDGWLEGQAQLNWKDILLIHAVRKMRGGDYHGAQALLNKIPPGYLKTPPPPKKDKYGEEGSVYYVQSKCLIYKSFPRRDEIACVKPDAKPVHLDIQAYCKWMASQTDKIAAARQKKSAGLSKLLYRLANAYASSWATGWPEVKTDNQSGPIHTYFPETNDRFPLGIPTVAVEMKARFAAFQNSTPNFYSKAIELYDEIIQLGKNRELSAKSFVCKNWVLMDKEHQVLTTQDKVIRDNLKLLKAKYSETEFYKDFAPRCSWLSELK